jgi:capsular exopolysaccharide synthesis family protein
MDETSRIPTLRDRLHTLRRFRVLIIAIVLAAGGLALGLSLRQDTEYVATAKLQFQDVNQDVGILGSLIQQSTQPAQLAAASAATLTRPEVVQRVKTDLGTSLTVDEIRDAITATAESVSSLVVVDAKAGSARLAADLANTTARVARDEANLRARNRFKAAARNLQRQISELPKDANPLTADSLSRQLTQIRALSRFARPAQIVAPADVPGSPVSPKPLRNTILAVFVGFILAIGVAFFANSLDRRLRSSHEIQTQLQLPLIGHVREEAMGKTAQAVNGNDELSAHHVEAFRILRANLDFLDIDSKMKTVAVTSALPQEGKSTVASSLAFAAASMGTSTLLVECDLRVPVLAKRLGIAQSPGLIDYLVGNATPQQILQPVAVPQATNGSGPVAGTQGSLVCITAGTPHPRAGELLGTERFRAFLEQVSTVYDLVILDTTPLLPVADARTLVPSVDRVLLCVRASRTTRNQALAGKAALDQLPGPVVGLVVTGEQASEETEYGYYTSYAYQDARA